MEFLQGALVVYGSCCRSAGLQACLHSGLTPELSIASVRTSGLVPRRGERRVEKRALRPLLRWPRRFMQSEGRRYQQSPSRLIRWHRGVNQDRRGSPASGRVLLSLWRISREFDAPPHEAARPGGFH